MNSLQKVPLPTTQSAKAAPPEHPESKFLYVRIIITLLFLLCYFAILGGIFWVEVSDSVNMLKGENSLMGELKILVGVMTAAVGNILHYWFKN
jgi:hypothetical protein